MLTLWGKEGYGWSPIVEAGKGVSTLANHPQMAVGWVFAVGGPN